MQKEKQERSVIHLQIGEQHWYFGNIKGIFERFTKEDIGTSYHSLRNYRLSPEKQYINEKTGVTIRKGALITTERKSKDE